MRASIAMNEDIRGLPLSINENPDYMEASAHAFTAPTGIGRDQLPVDETLQRSLRCSAKIMSDEESEPREKTAWKCGNYTIFMASKNPQKTCLAFQTDCVGHVVAIKHYEATRISQTVNPVKTAHVNLVNLLDVFSEKGVYHFAYELVEVSLQQFKSCFEPSEMEIAFICQEILHGLCYIHQELAICHNKIQCDNIFIDRGGTVKIGDIGACLLEGQNTSEQYDIRSVGAVMAELMNLKDCRSNILAADSRNSGMWSQVILDFQMETQRSCLCSLLRHVFLRRAPSTCGSLVVAAYETRRLVLHDYD